MAGRPKVFRNGAEKQKAYRDRQKSLRNADTPVLTSMCSSAVYPVIYADPPWTYHVYDRDTGTGRSAEAHYSTMTVQELTRINVASLAAPDCVLLLWATWPTLADAFTVGQAWGFQYKTCAFLWAKANKRAADRFTALDWAINWFVGLGFWTRANTEPCLLFTRGQPKRKSKAVRQLVVSPVGRHSQKPESIYGRIETLLDGPYLELFARVRRAGWGAIGNEIDGRDIRVVIGVEDQ